MRRRTFEVDKTEAKLIGVSAGLAKATGLDATIIRIGFVVATLAGGWPWTVVAYFVLGLVGQPGCGRFGRSARRSSLAAAEPRWTELDRRMAEIDSYVASSNSRLAREIEDLR